VTRLDRYGDPIEDDLETGSQRDHVSLTRAEIHRERCAELRRILRDAKARREAPRDS
jgi:hypothetical protein